MVLFTSIHASINNRIDTVVSPASRFLNLLAAFFKWVAFNPRQMKWCTAIGAAVSRRWTTLPPPPTPAFMYLPPGSLNGTMTTGGASYLVVAVNGNGHFLWDIGWTICQAIDMWIRSHIYTSIVIAVLMSGIIGTVGALLLLRHSERQSKGVRRYADTGRASPAPSPWGPAMVCDEDSQSPCPFGIATLPSPPLVPENSVSTTDSSAELDLDAIDFANIDPEDFGGRSDVDESDCEVREKDHSVAERQSEDEREEVEWAVYGRFTAEGLASGIALERSVLEDDDEDDEEYVDALSEQPEQQVGRPEVMPVYVDEYMEWSLGPFVDGEEVSPEIPSEQSVVDNAGDIREDVAFEDYSDVISNILEARSNTPKMLSIHLDGDLPVVLSHELESSSDSLDFIQDQLQEDDSASPCPPSPAFYSSPPSSIPDLVVNPPTPPLGNGNGYTVWGYHSSPEYLNSVPEDQDRSILSPDDVYDIIGDEVGDEVEYYVEDDGDEEWEDVSEEEEVYDQVYEGEYEEEEAREQDTSVVDHLEPLESLESSFELSEEAAEGLEDWINEDDAEEKDRTDTYADAQAAFNHFQSLGTVEAYSSDLMERFDAEDVGGLEEWIGEESVLYEQESEEGEPWVEWWYGGEHDQPEEGEFSEEDDEVEDEEDTVRLSHREVDDLEGFINDDEDDDDA